MRRFVAIGPSLVVLLTLAALMLAAPAIVERVGVAQQNARVVLARQTLQEDDILERLNAANRAVARAVEPSVVHIDVATERTRNWTRSSGSGWVYDDRGHIVTNAHVVFGAQRITVQFSDGRTASAELVATPDAVTDIAVLKIDSSSGIIPIRRATGIEPQKGDRVFVFGSPFGFKFSMSEGIISGLGRDADTPGAFNQFKNFIQTDAAVNPGNSGGPLVDIHGRIIGMNVAIATGRDGARAEGGQSAGISFAIPLGTVESVVEQIISTGKVTRGYLGVRWENSNAEYFPAIGRSGLRIGIVERDGPSAQAGLQSRDVITQIDGQNMTDVEILRSIITSKRPGSSVRVQVYRDDKPLEFTVVLGEFPREILVADASLNGLQEFGLLFQEQYRRLDITDSPVIRRVVPESLAVESDIQPGQRVIAVGSQDVSTIEEMLLALSDQGFLAGSNVLLTLSPQDGQTDPVRVSARVPRR